MTFTAEMLAAAVTNMLPLDPPPSEATIDAALEGIVRGFGADEALAQETRRLLHARFAVRMDVGQTLVSEQIHEPWLARRRATIEPFYWGRYREALLREGWGPLVTSTLDQATNQLLDLMGTRKRLTEWKRLRPRRRGCPVGQDCHLRGGHLQSRRCRLSHGHSLDRYVGERVLADPGVARCRLRRLG